MIIAAGFSIEAKEMTKPDPFHTKSPVKR